jgi:hypothetical protein
MGLGIIRRRIRILQSDAAEELDQIKNLPFFCERLIEDSASCRLLIVLLGPNGHLGFDANRDEENPVRTQLASALKDGVEIIPVMVGGAKPLSRADLPENIAGLARKKALVASDDVWESAMSELIARTQAALSPPRPAVLALNLLLFLAFFAWLGSWLDEATGVGDAIHFQWSLPLFSQGVLAVWAIVTQLFPYSWNPEPTKRIVSSPLLTVGFVLLFFSFYLFVRGTPVLVFRNSGTETVELRLYGNVDKPVAEWSLYWHGLVPSNSVRRLSFPFWNKLAGHYVGAERFLKHRTCDTESVSGIPLGLLTPNIPEEAKSPLQEGCAKPRISIPLLSRYFDPDPPEFNYPADANFEFVTIEPGAMVWNTMSRQADVIKSHTDDQTKLPELLAKLKLKIDIREFLGKLTVKADIGDHSSIETVVPYDGSPLGITTALPPQAEYIRGATPKDKVCMSGAKGDALRIYGSPMLLFGLPTKAKHPNLGYALRYQFQGPPVPKGVDVASWGAGTPKRASEGDPWSLEKELLVERTDTQEYCLTF